MLKLMNRVDLLGEADSGKTQILNSLIDAPFVSDYKKTMSPTFCMATRDKMRAQIWDTSGNEMDEMAYYDVTMGLYCIDLSKKIDVTKINAGIQAYREKCPNTPVILVGTKSDKCPGDAQAILSAINVEADIRVVTSAKHKMGISELSNLVLTSPSKEQQIVPEKELSVNDCKLTAWDLALSGVQHALNDLSQNKKEAMQKQLAILKDSLDNKTANRDLALDHFIENSEDILKDKHPRVMKAILKLVAVVVVTTLAAMIGFGIGFGVGLWTGPGAFISGFMAANAAAVAVAGTSMASGALVAHGLFKEPNALAATRRFAEEIKVRLTF